MKTKQAGFTLIEIAIVLVIIGLLLGGVLKGQEMIESAKIKNVRNDLEGIAAAVYTYQDRYRAYPGDDPRAGRWGAATAGNGDGDLESNTDAFTNGPLGANERRSFWQHLRYAGLLTGDATDNNAPLHAFGGKLGVVSGNARNPLGLSGSVVVCADMVPLKAAEALDTQLDDGIPASGSVRAMATAAANTDPGATPIAGYSDANGFYVVCKTM